MKAVSNSGPLIWLPRIGCLPWLERMFPDGLVIPLAVHREIVIQGKGKPGVSEIEAALNRGDLRLQSKDEKIDPQLVSLLERELDPGEAEAIALAQLIKPDRLLIDEHRAREKAKSLGIQVIGTLGILLQAKAWGSNGLWLKMMLFAISIQALKAHFNEVQPQPLREVRGGRNARTRIWTFQRIWCCIPLQLHGGA